MLEQVGRYRIERELGRGGMGVVYLADDPMLGRKVAIKTVHFEITDAGQREYLQRQLLRDARASAGLSHANVVNVHDIIESGDTTYLVMEYIAGETLAARMQRPPAPDTAWLLRVLRDIAAALDYTHRKGVVHRDVKPGNIMIDRYQHVKIMDFGLARATEHTPRTSSGLVAGTIQYMSPEQIRGDALDGRADQFSMAAVAYEMLTGKPLFEARTPVTLAQKIVNETPELAHVQNPALPEATSAVLGKALDRMPAGRYPTCTAFIEALITTFDGATIEALLRPPEEQPTVALTGMIDVDPQPRPSTRPVQTPGRFSAYAPWLVGAGLLVGAGGIATVAVINSRTNGEPATRPAQVTGPPPAMAPPVVPPKSSGPPPEIAKKVPPKKAPAAEPEVEDTAPPPPPPDLDERRHKKRKGDRPDRERPGFIDVPGFQIQLPDIATKGVNVGQIKIMVDGRRQLAARNYGIAAQLFTTAIQLKPDDYHAYYYRGAARLGAGDAKQAQADFEKVLELKPDYPQAWYQLGAAQEHQHRFKEALTSYAKAAELKPDMADAFYASAMIYDQQLAPKKALAELNKAIAANPKYGRGYQARADLKKKLGDATAADDQRKARELAAEKKGPPRPPRGPEVPIPPEQ